MKLHAYIFMTNFFNKLLVKYFNKEDRYKINVQMQSKRGTTRLPRR